MGEYWVHLCLVVRLSFNVALSNIRAISRRSVVESEPINPVIDITWLLTVSRALVLYSSGSEIGYPALWDGFVTF